MDQRVTHTAARGGGGGGAGKGLYNKVSRGYWSCRNQTFGKRRRRRQQLTVRSNSNWILLPTNTIQGLISPWLPCQCHSLLYIWWGPSTWQAFLSLSLPKVNNTSKIERLRGGVSFPFSSVCMCVRALLRFDSFIRYTHRVEQFISWSPSLPHPCDGLLKQFSLTAQSALQLGSFNKGVRHVHVVRTWIRLLGSFAEKQHPPLSSSLWGWRHSSSIYLIKRSIDI